MAQGSILNNSPCAEKKCYNSIYLLLFFNEIDRVSGVYCQYACQCFVEGRDVGLCSGPAGHEAA